MAAGGLSATYLVFLHHVEDRASNYLPGFADDGVDGNELGDHVADYVLRYADGSEHVHPIRRRFAIQQARIGWGASPSPRCPSTPIACSPRPPRTWRRAVVPGGLRPGRDTARLRP